MLTWLFQKVGILFTVIVAPLLALLFWGFIAMLKLIIEGSFK